jgi:hypothetical protein
MTAVTTEITFDGMSVDEFNDEEAKPKITAAIADVLEADPSMVTVDVKKHKLGHGIKKHKLGLHHDADDSVVLVVKVFGLPDAAAAMDAKVTAIQGKEPTFRMLATKVSVAAGPDVTCTASLTDPIQTHGHAPPTEGKDPALADKTNTLDADEEEQKEEETAK